MGAGIPVSFVCLVDRNSVQHPGFALCGRTSPLEPGEALEVIGEVGHADLDPGAGDADSADEQSHAVLLARGHMLNRRALVARQSG